MKRYLANHPLHITIQHQTHHLDNNLEPRSSYLQPKGTPLIDIYVLLIGECDSGMSGSGGGMDVRRSGDTIVSLPSLVLDSLSTALPLSSLSLSFKCFIMAEETRLERL